MVFTTHPFLLSESQTSTGTKSPFCVVTPFLTVTLNPRDISKIRDYNSKIGFKEFGCSNFKNKFLKKLVENV